MKIKSFRGGVHPPENKLIRDKKIEKMPPPKRVFIPLQQHTGAQCEPLVKVGDEVKKGDKIGESKSFVSAPVHASISGKVVEIKPYFHPVISLANTIIIEGNGATDFKEETVEYESLSKDELIEKIKSAGIVGLGGAAFPTAVKLSPPKDKKIDTVILNGAECEPYLTNDYRLMLENPKEIIKGLTIILKVLDVKNAFIGIELNKPEAIRIMEETCKENKDVHIEVVPLKVKYPQGAEKQLIKAILNREVPSGGLPFDVGVIVQNVGTSYAIYEAVVKNKPLIEKVITVCGEVKEPNNLLVPLGTTFAEVINYCGGIKEIKGEYKIIMGGPMMGLAQWTLEVPVIKGTSGILILKAEKSIEYSCIKCGKCVDVCPMNLMPNKIADFAEYNLFEKCKEYSPLDCIECGSCAYICPSHRPLVHLIKYAKLNVKR